MYVWTKGNVITSRRLTKLKYESELKDGEKKGGEFRKKSKKFSFWYNYLEKGLIDWQKKDQAKKQYVHGTKHKN